jgi:hypothetical protein
MVTYEHQQNTKDDTNDEGPCHVIVIRILLNTALSHDRRKLLLDFLKVDT